MDKLKMLPRLLACGTWLFMATAFAAGGSDIPMEKAEIEPDNVNSLQRGARNFMNYCSGCHSAQYVRYNTIGGALQLSDEQLIDNLMFNAEKTFETIRSAMSPADAARWYGVAPPDLSLIARAKGNDYLYNFLKGFYLDPELTISYSPVRACRTCSGNCRAIRKRYFRSARTTMVLRHCTSRVSSP